MSTTAYIYTAPVTPVRASGTRPRVTSQTSTTSVFTRTSYASMWEPKPLSTSGSMTSVSVADSDDGADLVKDAERSSHLQDVIAAYRHTQELEAINARRLHKQSSQADRYGVLCAAGREMAKLLKNAGQPVVPLVLISCEEEDIETWESSFTSDVDATPRQYIGQFVDYFGPPAIPSPHLLSPRKPAPSMHVTEPEEEEERQDSLLDALLDIASTDGASVPHTPQAVAKVKSHSRPRRIPKRDASKKRTAKQDTGRLLDLPLDIPDIGCDDDHASVPHISKAVDPSRPRRIGISKRDASKKRTKKEGSSKKQRAVKEADDVLAKFGEVSARLDKLDGDFQDLRGDIDAFDVELKAFGEELSRLFGGSA